MPTLQTTPATSSDKALDLHCPSKWSELTQDQLRYVFTLINYYPADSVKTFALCRFAGIQPIRKDTKRGWLCEVATEGGKVRTWIRTDEFAVMVSTLDYVEKPEECDTRFEKVDGCTPVDGLLHGVPFRDYLTLENYFQAYLKTKDVRYLDNMTAILYLRDGEMKRSMKVDDTERTNTLYWYIYIKNQFNRYFSHFFIPVGDMGGDVNPMEMMNAQIRLLTGGDITKEEQVLSMDCWRALTELDARAKIAQEQKRKH